MENITTTKDIGSVLEIIKNFENDGLIQDPRGEIDLEVIVNRTSAHFGRLQEQFGEIGQEIRGQMLDMTGSVYVSLFNPSFLGQKTDRSEKYRPENFLEAVQTLSYEMSDESSLMMFYQAINLNLTHSTRFVYHLLVRDLSEALDKAKKQVDYSREAFSQFTLEVLNQALQYSQWKIEDKWNVFKPLYDSIKKRHLPSTKIGEVELEGDPDINYVSKLVNQGQVAVPITDSDNGNYKYVSPAEIFQSQVGTIYGLRYSSKAGQKGAHMTVLFGDLNQPESLSLEVTKGQDGVSSFFSNLAEMALYNLSQHQNGFNSDLITPTRQAKIAIDKHL